MNKIKRFIILLSVTILAVSCLSLTAFAATYTTESLSVPNGGRSSIYNFKQYQSVTANLVATDASGTNWYDNSYVSSIGTANFSIYKEDGTLIKSYSGNLGTVTFDLSSYTCNGYFTVSYANGAYVFYARDTLNPDPYWSLARCGIGSVSATYLYKYNTPICDTNLA